jgi:hypothetical protein
MSQAHSKEAIGTLNSINHCLRLSHFPNPWKEAKIITLPKPGKDPKFPQNLHPVSHLSTTGKLFEKVILKLLQKHIDGKATRNRA